MFTNHPEVLLSMERERRAELIAEAERSRLLGSARLIRRIRRATSKQAETENRAITLPTCGQSVVQPR